MDTVIFASDLIEYAFNEEGMVEGIFPSVLTYLEYQKNTLSESEHILMLICTALGRLRWSLWKSDVASVFSKSPAEISTPIGAVCPVLVNLAQYVLHTCICE